MKTGDIIKVYDKVDTVKEVCDHGITHNVPIYSVKRLTITHVTQEVIPFLLYTQDGVGNVYWAVDHQGRQYTKKDHWDGPRATLWVRNDKKTFTQYPRPIFSRDLTGLPLSL